MALTLEQQQKLDECIQLYQENRLEALVDVAEDYLKKHQQDDSYRPFFDALLSQCTAWLEKQEEAKLYYLSAYLHAMLKNYEAAIHDAEKAAELAPTYGTFYHLWGNCLVDLGKDEEAIEKYAKAVELVPKDAVAYNNLGNSLSRLGKYEQALEQYSKATKQNPAYSVAFLNWGNSLFELGRYEEAIDKYATVRILNPTEKNVWHNWGIILSKLGYPNEALEKYERATELNPDNSYCWNSYGLALSAMGKDKRAIEIFAKAVDLDPNLPEIYYNWGLSLYNLGRFNEAIKKYNKAIKLKQNFFQAYANLGICHAEIGQNERALEFFKIAKKINPKEYIVQYNLGQFFSKTGRFQEAIDSFTESLGINANCQSYFNRANAYKEIEDWDKAKQDYEVALNLAEQQNDDYIRNLARSSLKDFEKIKEEPALYKQIKEIKKLLECRGTAITHYTSLTTLQILAFGKREETTGAERRPSFRLSEGTYLNDASEGRVLYDFLEMEEAVKAQHPHEAMEFAEKPFIGSFVIDDKQDDLTLWRMYGKQGTIEATGCSLTLASDPWLKAIEKEINTPRKEIDNTDKFQMQEKQLDFPLQFYHVAYIALKKKNNNEKDNDNENENIILPTKKGKEVETLSEKLYNLKSILKEKTISTNIREMVAEIAYLFKGIEYQYEHEVRLMVAGGKNTFDRQVELTESGPRVYIELPSFVPALTQVTLGPKASQAEEWAAALFYHFENEGIDAPVCLSQIPFK